MNVFDKVAELHGVSVEEVRAEICAAIREAGLNVSPESFTLACALLVSEAAPRVAAAGGIELSATDNQ